MIPKQKLTRMIRAIDKTRKAVDCGRTPRKLSSMISIKAKPESKKEIRTVIDIKCAELGVSRSTWCLSHGISRDVLGDMLNGRIKHTTHPDLKALINEFTGAKDFAWDK